MSKRKKLLAFALAAAFFACHALSVNAAVIPDPADGGVPANIGEAFADLFDFFEGWIRAVGMVVVFIGALQFGLAVKEDNADGKAKSITVIASGAMIFGMISGIVIFSRTKPTNHTGVDEFYYVMKWAGAWMGRVGVLVAFVGALMFGLAVQQENAEQKTRGVMTLAAGFIVFAVSNSLQLFGLA